MGGKPGRTRICDDAPGTTRGDKNLLNSGLRTCSETRHANSTRSVKLTEFRLIASVSSSSPNVEMNITSTPGDIYGFLLARWLAQLSQ